MTDNQGGTSTATVTVTVTGLNDAPTSTPSIDADGIDNTPVTLNVSTQLRRPDASDPLTFSASNLPPGLSINPTTGIITGTIAGNASVSGPYSVTITAVDPHGGRHRRHSHGTCRTRPQRRRTNDAATTNENASTTGNVLTNDTDPDGDTLGCFRREWQSGQRRHADFRKPGRHVHDSAKRQLHLSSLAPRLMALPLGRLVQRRSLTPSATIKAARPQRP